MACRTRHMKCDSIEPTCSRCQLEEATCVYTKSRRGVGNRIDDPKRDYQRPIARSYRQTSAISLSLATDYSPSSAGTSSGTLSNFVHSDFETFYDTAKNQKLVCLYYEFFHHAHPFLMPKKFLCSKLRKDPESLEHLFPVLEYIGSIYMPEVPTDPLLQRAHDLLNSINLPFNGFTVQALLLLALALHCSDEYKIAEQYLDRAIDIALTIGMNRQCFAVQSGEGDLVLQESWRRTWWSLYLIDAIFAAISHYSTHRLQIIEEEVDLPCEDIEYEKGASHSLLRPFESANQFSDDTHPENNHGL